MSTFTEDQSDIETQNRRRVRILFICLCILMIGLFYFSIGVDPNMIVEQIGVTNGYIIAFCISLFAGISAPTAATAYSFIATLIAGGLNPFILGVLTGCAFSIGDMLWFSLGSKGRSLLTGKIDKRIKQISSYIEKKQLEKYIPFFGYIYMTFSPFPNDWLLLFLAAIQFPPKKTYLLIVLGDISFMLFFSFLISQGITIFM